MTADLSPGTAGLSADHAVAFSYRRSLGTAERTFLDGLRRGELWGSVDAGGRVTVPPVGWDPTSGAPSTDFVRVGDEGVVRTWTWVPQAPSGQHPDGPHAVALVQLSGADTCLLHLVDVADEAVMHSGMTVKADWRSERTGSVTDIRAFVPCDSAGPVAGSPTARSEHDIQVVSDTRLAYRYEPGLVLSRFLRALADGRIEGGRCPLCGGVYAPPRAKCPACLVGPLEIAPLSDAGTVTSYTVVHIPFPGMEVELPFVCAWIRLDGASVPFAHLLGEVRPDEVTVGQRVEAVWAAEADREPSWESIRYFRPSTAGGGGR